MQATDLDLLTDAARKSGQIAVGYFGQSPQVWDKPDDSGPVTAADLAVNAMLQDSLRAARPDYGWLSEETEDDAERLKSDTIFMVDPIDGTRAFINGSKDWAHALAVVHKGQVTAAAVYLPMRDAMFTASLGGGAFLNGDPIKPTIGTDLAEATVLSHKANCNGKYWKSGASPDMKLAFRSSLAYRICLVAQGRFDAMITLRPTWEWDVAAGTLILSEAGGVATTQKGQSVQFNNPHPQLDGLVAAGGVQASLLALLA
ncbi:MAG: myo-inositol-1(or 4)-monophosphatase [Reinekea sp.]